jgi:hypothetical protein
MCTVPRVTNWQFDGATCTKVIAWRMVWCLIVASLLGGFARAQSANVPATEEQRKMNAARKLVQQQQAWGEATSTPGTKLIFKEKSRKKTDQGTLIDYDVLTIGLPKDQHYALVAWPLNEKIRPVQSGISLTADGRPTCTGRTKVDCRPSKADVDPVIDIAFYAAKGEPKRFGLVSEDQRWKAFGTIVAFPNVNKDGACSLEAQLVTPDADAVFITGHGFTPNIPVPQSTDSAGEVMMGTWPSNAKGDLATIVLPAVRGKTSGDATILVMAPACRPKITFHWGKGSYHVE